MTKMQYAGKWVEPRSNAIDLPFTRESLRQVLAWGSEAGKAPFCHQDIAHWCERFWHKYSDIDAPKEIEGILPILADVECQWDLYLANTYKLEELQKLAFQKVVLPVEWFEGWIAEFEGRILDSKLIQLNWLWKLHLSHNFPRECAGRTINGIELALLDSTIAGHASTAIRSRGVLAESALEDLRRAVSDINAIVGELPESAKIYFLTLKSIAGLGAEIGRTRGETR